MRANRPTVDLLDLGADVHEHHLVTHKERTPPAASAGHHGIETAGLTARIWASVLRCDADLNSSSDFHVLGGDSLIPLEMLVAHSQGHLGSKTEQQFLDRGLTVDLVCEPNAPSIRPDVPFQSVGANNIAEGLVAASSDECALVDRQQDDFRAPALSTGPRLLNIHHGPLPRYRGVAEVALVYAMLRGEQYYAVTLREVDEGIDTGATLAVAPHPIGQSEPYQVVLRRGLQVCQQPDAHLGRVADGRVVALAQVDGGARANEAPHCTAAGARGPGRRCRRL